MSKNVSNEFKNIIKSGGPFYPYIKMTLSDGTELNLTADNDFLVDGDTGYSEGSESGFPLGAAISKKITFLVNNNPDQEYDYYYARLTLYTEADLLSGTTERIQEGIFTIIDSVKPGDTLEITAYDDMYKSDVNFTSSLTYPVSAQQLLNEVCDFCDITLGSVTFPNNNFQIQQAPEGLTGRQVIGYIAQIAGGNAVIDRTGRLIIKTYNMSGFDSQETVTAGEIETASGIHIISEYTEYPDIGTDNVAITGVSVTIPAEDSGSDDEVYVSGTEDYAISIDNPLIVGQEKYAADLIAAAVVGVYARPFTGSFLPDPTIEFMDLAYLVDTKDNVYKTYITRHNFAYIGNSTIENGMESPEKHGGSYYSNASDVYQKAKNEIKINKTQWEQAMEHLTEQVANASGLYTTEEVQDDGSIIYYMHNKPTLEESDMVWKMTAETITVSTDGGKTWNAGITINGEVIAKIINTIAINFDRGVGGTLILQTPSGEQTVYMDANTGAVRLSVESLTVTGKTVDEIAGEKAESSINDFVDAVYGPDISNLQAQIDGQIETWFDDYVPTTSNYPASEWNTETEKDKHLGDLFYIVDNAEHGGEAYRWAKINNEYTWDYVEDTAVVKALANAATAQDTADQKRRVFVSQPYPPYDVGDLWVGNDTSDLMRCQRARASGNFDVSDWIKAVKYTDDSELYNFVQNDYNETIQEIYNSVDKKAETYYQPTDPSLEWESTTDTPLQDISGDSILDTAGSEIITIFESDKSLHNGDLWKNPTNNKEYMYVDGEWVEMSIPDDLFDTIDGKAQIFVVQPTPPYAVGDVWFTGTTILVCNTARESGSFNANDWAKRDSYTDDSALYNFIEGDYASTIDELQTQSDKKAETWYQGTDPSSNWDAAQKAEHEGDLWYNTSNQKTYIYDGTTWQETKSTPPDEVFDSIDGKAQIFISQPTPPYSKGDLWFDSTTSDIMTCIASRSTGSFNAGDWQKRNKYTDDSYAQEINAELNEFISNYQDEITEIQSQIDKKAETWYQSTDPSLQWTDTESGPLQDTTGTSIFDTTGATIVTIYESEKALHDGDLWHDTTNNKEYIYVDGEWQETSIPDDVFDIIDGKAQIFVSTPTPPYAIGDLWFNSVTSDIMTCIVGRETGSYNASDWQKRNKYTDDSYAEGVSDDLQNFADQVTGDIDNIQTQLDGKIETYYYDYEPTLSNIPASAWTTEEERQKHIGDLFYWKSKGFTYRFLKDGSTWKWQAIKDSDIDEALSQAAAAQDTADGKRRVFTTTPVPPYDVGDLWAQGSSGDIMRCKKARTSGENYVSTDWEPASKYTDDSAVDDLDEALNQQGIFNRLTNDGLSQGIFLENGQLYLNGEYMEFDGATIGGWLVSGNQLRNDQTNFEVKIQAPTVYGTSGLSTADIIAVHDKEKNTWPFVVTSDGSMDLGDEFQYRPNGFTYDSTVQMNVGGWQIKKAQNVWGYNEVIYWDTIETQTNGIGAKGPWVIWGGWNGGASLDYVNNYKFVVSDVGDIYAQRFFDNGQQLLPIVVEVTHKTLTNDFCYVSKSGYYLLACYLIRSVDHNIYVKAIQYRNDNTYTVALQGANGGEIDLYTMWAKMPD